MTQVYINWVHSFNIVANSANEPFMSQEVTNDKNRCQLLVMEEIKWKM
jgi:hypothetical protein